MALVPRAQTSTFSPSISLMRLMIAVPIPPPCPSITAILAIQPSSPVTASGILILFSCRRLVGHQQAPCPKQFMVPQDILFALAGFHFEITQRHAPRIRVAFVPPIQDACNLETPLTPVEPIGFLGLAVLIPSANGDAFELHERDPSLPAARPLPDKGAASIVLIHDITEADEAFLVLPRGTACFLRQWQTRMQIIVTSRYK